MPRQLLTAQDYAAPISAAPAAGAVSVGRRGIAGADFLAVRSAQGIERLLQPMLARGIFAANFGTGANAFSALGMPLFTTVGTLTARAPSTSAVKATRAKRTGVVSVATAGGLASIYGTTGLVSLASGASDVGGFLAVFRFVVSDAAAVSGARMFVGLSSTVAAPTNVEPSTLTNQIGVAQISTSNNLQLVFGGGTAQTPVDLGANFPANTLSADLYELILFADPNSAASVGYELNRNGGDYVSGGFSARGTITNTTPGTTLPSGTTMLAMRHWRTNNATPLAVGLDVVASALIGDY